MPTKLWDRVYGGSGYDGLASMQRTADGGYILGGTSFSGISGDKSQISRGHADFWVVKIDAQGQKQWDRTFGGDQDDYVKSVQQTADGGYIVGGSSESDVSGDKTTPRQVPLYSGIARDYWLVRLDAQGNKLWDRNYGGNDIDEMNCMQQTADGGFVMGGKSYSGISGDKSESNRGSGDYWVVKVDAQGVKQWDRTLGSSQDDSMETLQQTTDGGYIVGGWSGTGVSGDRTQANRGSNDFWIVKLNAQGTKQWDRAYGGNNSDLLECVRQTSDGGYILAGSSDSDVSGEKTRPRYSNNSGYNYDYWVVKTDAAGTLQWERTYGGNAIDNAYVVRQTTDGGFVLGGVSSSGVSFDKTQPNQGSNDGYDMDYWLLKLDASGAKQWDRSYGGNAPDYLYGLDQTPDGGYMLGGYSASAISSDKSLPSKGSSDYWLVRLGPAPVGPAVTISGDSVLCPGRSLTLTAATTPAPTAYRWSTGATTASITVAQSGTYSVVATFASGLTNTSQYQVRAVPAIAIPVFRIGADTMLCEGQRLTLRAPQPAVAGLTYRWSDGSTGPSLVVRQAGTYSLEISSACDRSTASIAVAFTPCLTVPNIITPNGDQTNEQFVILGLGAVPWSLEVYNRWGRRVYQSADYQNNWGREAAPGVYYYLLRQAAAAHVFKGWVEIRP